MKSCHASSGGKCVQPIPVVTGEPRRNKLQGEWRLRLKDTELNGSEV